jgi:hypothetical protein
MKEFELELEKKLNGMQVDFMINPLATWHLMISETFWWEKKRVRH